MAKNKTVALRNRHYQKPSVLLTGDACGVFAEHGQFLECTRTVYYIHVHINTLRQQVRQLQLPQINSKE